MRILGTRKRTLKMSQEDVLFYDELRRERVPVGVIAEYVFCISPTALFRRLKNARLAMEFMVGPIRPQQSMPWYSQWLDSKTEQHYTESIDSN